MYHYYCTECSMEYCYQGLVLYDSLAEYDKDFKLFIICLDNKMVQFLKNLQYSSLIPIDVHDIEEAYKELLSIKPLRNMREYAWTLKPSIVMYILENFDYVDHILWMDSDMQFLFNPEPLYNDWGDSSILLSEQYYTDAYEYLVSGYGKYQAGLIGFKKNENGMECLKWWQKKCIEWCSDKADNMRWADQKYLDEFPQKFKAVGVVGSLGINLTPFIVYRINTEQGKVVVKKNDGLYIDDVRIILYHYYGLRFYKQNEYDLSFYWMMFDEETIKLIYMPYIAKCQEAIRKIQNLGTLQFKLKPVGGNQVTNYYNLNRAYGVQNYDICIMTSESDLIKCMTLYYSITQHSKKIHIWICCMDDFSSSTLNNEGLENVTVINSRSFETQELLELRKTCSEKEYMHLLKPHYIYYILKNNFSVNYLLYVGADVYFYRSPVYLLREFENGSVFLYRLPKINEDGTSAFNTNLIGFKRDKNALECLINWKDKSIGWHFEKTKGNESPEENYIDTWPLYISGVRVLESKNRPIYEKLQKKYKDSVKRAILTIKKFKGIIDEQ